MKQDTNMEHSAEWLRGAYRIASRYAPMDVVMQINVQLAAAEAREAALEKHEIAAYLEWQGKDGIKCGTFQPSEEGPREPTYTTTVREWRKLVARAEAREAAQPSAAEVIRVAKAALEGCRGNVANHSDGHHKQFIRSEEMAEKALAAIAAWEAGNGKP